RAARERALHVAVAQRRRAARAQAVGHREHDEIPPRLPLEHAVAVGELAGAGGDLGDLARARVERAHGDDGVAHFLPIGADVLDRRGAHEPGDAAQAFEPGPAALDAVSDDAIPGL